MVSLLYFLEDCFIAVKETVCVCERERECVCVYRVKILCCRMLKLLAFSLCWLVLVHNVYSLLSNCINIFVFFLCIVMIIISSFMMAL